MIYFRRRSGSLHWNACAAAILACLLGAGAHARESFAMTERTSFNRDWQFARFGPQPDGTQRAEPAGLEAPSADTKTWSHVTLPHDWAIAGPFRPELPNETAKLPWVGTGWYRKLFSIPATDRGRRIFVDFDGAMSHAQLWLNGAYLGEWPYGYSSFRLELTPQLRFGEDNVLAVRLENPPASSRWYPGGGLYRNVWLVKSPPVHLGHWGVFVTTPEVSPERAIIEIRTTIDNQTDRSQPAVVTVRHEIARRSAPDEIIARTEHTKVLVGSDASAVSVARLEVALPVLWNLDSPQLYLVRTTLLENAWPLDAGETTFGIRRVTIDPLLGLELNGRRVRLNGVCLHHDLGPLGTAVSERAIERQLELLREMGCNAIRTSHNPPAPELLDLCDRLGFAVVDEAFDCWHTGKRANDYSRHFDAWHERDVRALVQRDRNHPSVILWSSGNEIHEQQEPDGLRLAQKLLRLFHTEDPTRLVTGGLDFPGSIQNGFARGFDVVGLNYKPHLYADSQRTMPDRAVFGSETASTLSSRGEYFFPLGANAIKADAARDPAYARYACPVTTDLGDAIASFQVGSHDLFHPPWATTPDVEFASQDRHPFVLGEFVWTGFDYLGEPSPYRDAVFLSDNEIASDRRRITEAVARNGGVVPARSSYFGIFDLCGFRKDRFYLYQARWRPELPVAHLLPHWNWPERLGQVTPVHVYTSGDEAELFLNGQSLGRRRRGADDYRLRWDDVVYQPGELKVIAYKAGREWATAVQRTTGAAAQLALTPDRTELRADGRDLAFVTVTVCDDSGAVNPRAADRVRFATTGPADIVAVDNGDATRLESFQASDCRAFNGRVLVILRTRANEHGEIILRAIADHLRPASVALRAGAAGLHAVE